MSHSGATTQTYFTCTLGEAEEYNTQTSPSFKTVNDLIDTQAKLYPNSFAVGFPVPRKGGQEWDSELFSFAQLRKGTINIAAELSIILNEKRVGKLKSVALLCPSSVDFLFTWLALMRAGLSVLLIAPQCQPDSIAHLCKSCEASCLLHHEIYSDLASAASQIPESNIIAMKLPWKSQGISIGDALKGAAPKSDFTAQDTVSENDTAYIHHTSGTSTGLPKPIPQTHRAGVGVLARLDGQHAASFTTTPLYHGGIADCFRAWTSKAMIWIFPGTDAAITSKSILASLAVAAKMFKTFDTIPPVKYFSSVPYVLKMLAQDPLGLSMLQKMELVGVGGAALPAQVGDSLVQIGVNLLSRFGSAECGFLLSSHRQYQTDKDWQYLRVPYHAPHLRFEEQGDGSGLSELVILRGWPHMARTNRPDGSFATSDLFEPHPTIKNAWKYHSRSDSQITLSTGKKFDPGPIEDVIASSSPLLREAFIFGNGKQNPGALVFRSGKAENLTNENLEKLVWELMQTINSKGQDHTRISKSMLVIMPIDSPPLKRSSKGTLLRRVAEETFARDIDHAYENECRFVEDGIGNNIIEDKEVDMVVRDIVMGKFGQGVDLLPWSVVYDCGSINGLANYILEMRNGQRKETTEELETQEMLELVERFSTFNPVLNVCHLPGPDFSPPLVVVLTGATGGLGAHVLDILRNMPTVSQIFCLVRASDHKEARTRVSNSLIQRRKEAPESQRGKVLCVPSSLGDSNLGISDELFSYLQQRATHIIHAAWAVNFSLPLKSFISDHLVGLHNLLKLTMSCSNPAQMIYCSSTASVLRQNQSAIIEEKISLSPENSDSLGYSRSKWVAEAICFAASKQAFMQGRCKVLRIGQLTGDTENGIWNTAEAFPLILSTVNALHCLPQIDEKLTWLPLDLAAKAVIEIALTPSKAEESKTCLVYHLASESTDTLWVDLLKWLQEISAEPFEVVDAGVWMAKLEELQSHPAKNLLWLWRRTYGTSTQKELIEPRFSVNMARAESEAMRNVKDVDRMLVSKIWNWLQG